MKTHFASAERCHEDELRQEVAFVAKSPVVDGLLQTIPGLMAVLDERRQIIAINDSMLQMLGAEDFSDVLGLRPGEAIHCIHALEEPNGCGTTEFCSSCGAAISIVTSLQENRPVERICAATIIKDDEERNICFSVRAAPILLENRRFLLLFMQDITAQQAWATMERLFFHDVGNIIQGLAGTNELMLNGPYDQNTAKRAVHLVWRLQKEMEIQRFLIQEKSTTYRPSFQRIFPSQILNEVKDVFASHRDALDKHLLILPDPPSTPFFSDYSLLMRVFQNMLVNAFEATEQGGTVKFWIEEKEDQITFNTWNKTAISEEIQPRIFQRHFSTKEETGRGLGTYAMKLFGEKLLNGTVKFRSTEEQGTIFTLSLPLT